PGPGYSAFITNAGWKAVAIGSSTARDYPSSLTLYTIEVHSPVDSFNTLLLNYIGVQSPVSLESALYIGSNSACVVLSSALHAQRYVLVDGTFTQTDFSGVATENLHLGIRGAGIYNMTNGTLNATNNM